mgnify:FL=1
MRQAIILGTCLAVVALALGACAPAPPPPTPTVADRSYSVRGEIVRLPDPADPQYEIWIRHEAIPDFTTDSGEVVGMDAMTMPFGVADGLDLSAVAVGDKILFTLTVSWADRAQPARVTAIEKLSEETELTFAPPH